VHDAVDVLVRAEALELLPAHQGAESRGVAIDVGVALQQRDEVVRVVVAGGHEGAGAAVAEEHGDAALHDGLVEQRVAQALFHAREGVFATGMGDDGELQLS